MTTTQFRFEVWFQQSASEPWYLYELTETESEAKMVKSQIESIRGWKVEIRRIGRLGIS